MTGQGQEPITPEQRRINRLREMHELIPDPVDPHCYQDQTDWPCDVGFLLAEVDRLTRELADRDAKIDAIDRILTLAWVDLVYCNDVIVMDLLEVLEAALVADRSVDDSGPVV